MNHHHRVSFGIPCYNAEKWVGECIASALGQSWSNIEVVVVDGGSTDSSRDVIAAFGDRVCHDFGLNRGGAVARNRGLALSRGVWVQILDAEDILLK